jgi:hypothetical protein
MTKLEKILRDIQAFASEYAHNIDGRDVVIVDQLLVFLSDNPNYAKSQGGNNG